MKARDDLTTPALRAKRNATISCQDGATAGGARPFFRFSHGDFNASFLNRFHLGGEWNNLVPFKLFHPLPKYSNIETYYVLRRRLRLDE